VRLRRIAVFLFTAAGIASAGTIGYSVNETAGGSSATGTITTDGTLGTLYGNIVDWDLTITDGTNSFTATGPLSGDDSELGFAGSDLTAISSNLSFDFSRTDGVVLFFEPPPIIRHTSLTLLGRVSGVMRRSVVTLILVINLSSC
jgi:hypothetical protein